MAMATQLPRGQTYVPPKVRDGSGGSQQPKSTIPASSLYAATRTDDVVLQMPSAAPVAREENSNGALIGCGVCCGTVGLSVVYMLNTVAATAFGRMVYNAGVANLPTLQDVGANTLSALKGSAFIAPLASLAQIGLTTLAGKDAAGCATYGLTFLNSLWIPTASAALGQAFESATGVPVGPIVQITTSAAIGSAMLCAYSCCFAKSKD